MVGVLVGVGVFVGVLVGGTLVFVGVEVRVGVFVGVLLGVLVGVRVGVFDGVGVFDAVGVLVGVLVGVEVAPLVLVGVDGRRVPVDVRALGIVDHDGEFAGIQGATRDVSHQVQLQNELRRQAGELARSEDVAGDARGLHGDSGVARNAVDLLDRRRLAELPNQGVLAAATTYY